MNIDQQIIDDVSKVIGQYIKETGTKDKNTIIHFSAFSEFLVKQLVQSKNDNLSLINLSNEDIFKVAKKRLEIFNNNIDLYSQLEHLLELDIPDYVIEDIIESVNFLFDNFDVKGEMETRDFYCRFGENIVLDLQTSAKIDIGNRKKGDN